MKSFDSKISLSAFALFAAAIIYRVGSGVSAGSIGWLPNFSPLAAIALCGAIYLPRRFAFVLPLAVLFLSDLVLNAHFGVALLSTDLLSRYAVLTGIVAVGFALRKNLTFGKVLTVSLGGSVLFYLVTNTAAWAVDGAYAKNFAGWVQALTVGELGFAPTWTFFRSSLVSDTLFTSLFVGCMSLAKVRVSSPLQQQAIRVSR